MPLSGARIVFFATLVAALPAPGLFGAPSARVWLATTTGRRASGNLLKNGDLEAARGQDAANWTSWGDGGYERATAGAHSGRWAARCQAREGRKEYGLGQEIVLNQQTPTPLIASAWSKAAGVTGAPNSDYSLYLDLEYMDGTPLWGQTAPFDTGTHDWQPARVTIVPSKPVRKVKVYGIFRRHQGTVWFDDFRLTEMRGASVFDFVPVAGSLPSARPDQWRRSGLLIDEQTGAMTLDPGRMGGLVVRDAAAQTDFFLPRYQTHWQNDQLALKARVDELDLQIEALITFSGDWIQLAGEVSDERGADRAVTLVWAIPTPARPWNWCQDPRTTVPCTGTETYGSYRRVRAGVGGVASWYPFAAIADNGDAGLALGAPIDQPRLWRFAFDAGRRILYAACDLGLSQAAAKFPGRASFRALFFRFAPEQRFRGALKRYYELNAPAFTRRVKRQGLWMPFTDIATVAHFEDFGFQFQEGAPNPAFDETHGIYSFPYIEPMSYWLAMPKTTPRTPAAARSLLLAQAKQGNRRALATLSSVLAGPAGAMNISFHHAPWCDGALFLLNPDPDLHPSADSRVTQYQVHRQTVERILRDAVPFQSWGPYDAGYQVTRRQGRNASRAPCCRRGPTAPPMGLTQAVLLNQKTPTPLLVSAWSRAENVTGRPDADYSLYVDLRYADGDRDFGHHTSFATGTHDWQRVTLRLTPKKAVETAFVYLLFRGDHHGVVWFDDVAMRSRDETRNLVVNGDFEKDSADVHLDGLYLDSFEMAATELNYRREHFASADIPLVFDAKGRVCQLGHFLALELARKTAADMHAAHKLMFANAVLHTFPWPAACLDIFGTETNWLRDGKYAPPSDATMLYWRALAWQRPYVTLLNTPFDKFPHAWVERYFQRCCAYGILPSMFSPNASGATSYWVNPKLYNRDRDLFRKYIPVIRRLAEAGWEPVTHAQSSDPAVWVERFGATPAVFLTVFNSSPETRKVQLTLDLPTLFTGRQVTVTRLLPDSARLGVFPAARNARLPVRLQPEQVVVLRLGRQS